MQKSFHQIKRWLAVCLSMMLVITGLLPMNSVLAASSPNWTKVTNPYLMLDNPSDTNRPGTDTAPILMKNRILSGITAEFATAQPYGTGIIVTVNNQQITNNQFFNGNTVVLPDIPLDRDGALTKVTVRPTNPVYSNDTLELYYRLIKDPNVGSITFASDGTVPVDNNSSPGSPIDVSNSRISGLKFTYSSSLDTAPNLEVRLNGSLVQTLTGSNNQQQQITDLYLIPGLNQINVYSVNNGVQKTIYYRYNAPDKPIIIDSPKGSNGEGGDAYRPLPYSDSKITLKGTFGAGVVGSNLRLKISTNNDQTITDLDKTAPTITNNNFFTFTDIALQPGLNKISFYEKIGSITREHTQFYVFYNNTPLLDNLMINDTELGNGTTLIKVPSTNRLVLNMSGDAVNATSVEVRNVTTAADPVNATVSRAGLFALNLPVKLGENVLEINVYSQNKKVGTIQKTIQVVSTSQESADQFYNARIVTSSSEFINLVPDQVATVRGYVPAGGVSPTFNIDQITGDAILQYVPDIANSPFEEFKITIKDTDPRVTKVIYAITSSFPMDGAPQDGFTKVKGVSFGPASSFVDSTGAPVQLQFDHTYKVTLSYKYKKKDSTGALNSTGDIIVNSYEYQFKYVDGNKPQFVSVAYGTSPLSENDTNIIKESTPQFAITTANMSSTGSIRVYYNNTLFTQGIDYTLSPLSTSMNLSFLKNLPAGTGTLTLEYYPPSGTTATAKVEYKLKLQVTPGVHLTYVDNVGQVRSFEDGQQINSEDEIRDIYGKVYNYQLTAAPNFTVKLNGSTISPKNVDPVNRTFSIDKNDLNGKNYTQSNPVKLNKGNNKLEIILQGTTPVTFTYNILYITSKAPTIEDIKLKAIFNKKEEDLEKKPADPAYQTEAQFLTNFSFTVKDATHVYIEKNGKRITDFRYKGSWEQDKNNLEYDKTIREVPTSQLQRKFEDVNFDAKSKTKFEAKMTSSKYDDLLETVQDDVKKQEDQERVLSLFPLNLNKNGSTIYTIVAEDDNGTVVRYNLTINQKSNSWEVLSPRKARKDDKYITVNSNSVPIEIFAENADKVLFGKVEATVDNVTNPDFYFDKDLGKKVAKTYYVFKATVPLKKGLNTIKYTVQVGNNKYNDQVQIFNANSSVDGAEYRDVLGKKTSFSVFDKALDLKFPAGTVLLSPTDNRAGQEVKNPSGDIYVDVPLYFGIADRTTGQVSIEGDNMKSRLILDANFNYASPLYYIDGGYINKPGGRDPYHEEDESNLKNFKSRYQDNLVPSRIGTLSIKYDAAIVNAANNVLTIYYNNGSEWKNIGGVVDTGKKVITVPFEGFGYYMVMKNRESFDDVVHHDFARDDMETLYSKGIMPAASGSNFGANRDMRRGEFATMLVKALDLPIKAGPYKDSNERYPLEPTFTDVYPNADQWDYQYKYIETAARAGIIRGTEPGYFRPDQPLTREEAAIMIARAMNLKISGSPELAKANLQKLFTDGKDVNYYAAAAVLAVTKAKLMNGEPNDPTAKKPTYRFIPQKNLTRAEMATITVRVMIQLKKLPKK